MSRALTAPAPRRSASPLGKARMGKPEQSRLILTSTAGIICAVLFLWLLIAPRIIVPVQIGPVYASALPLPDAAGGAVTFPTADARLVSGSAPKEVAGSGSAKARLERELRDYFEKRKGRSAVVYLEAAGATVGGSSDARTYLLTSGDSLGDPIARISLDDVLKALRNRGQGTSVLLVLDLAQVGPSRDLGAFGVDVVSGLKEQVGKDSSLAVLLSCAPGQMSWTSEAAGRSIFAHYLAEALDERAWGSDSLTAGKLLEYVRHRVRRWAYDHRGGAIQTPVLLGDESMRVALPERAPLKAEAAKFDAEKLRSALMEEWDASRKLAAQPIPPRRHASAAWRRYLAELLRAERLLRSGSPEAPQALEVAQGERARVEQQTNGPALAHPWSLALARTARGESLAVQPDEYEKAVENLLDVLKDQQAPAAEPPPQPEPKADAEPEKPKGDAPKAKKDAAAPKNAAKADSAARGNARGKPETPAKAAASAAAGPDLILAALAPLTEGGAGSGVPLYVEGQVPVWYAEFVRRGCETPALREPRLAAVRRAFEVRKVAEEACVDPRVARWVRPLIEKADPIRREAQDYIFSGDKAGLDLAQARLDEAEELYKQAQELAGKLSRGMDLLEALQDELPWYGEWLARRPGPMDEKYLALLEAAGQLADLAYSAPTDPTSMEKAREKFLADSAKLERQFRDFRASADTYAAKVAGSDNWRELDAALNLPMLDPKRRAEMLGRVGSKELSPAPESNSDSSFADEAEVPPDPAFWTRAVGLALVEGHLAKLGGLNDAPFWSGALQAKSNWESAPATALTGLGSVAAESLSARERLIKNVLGDPTALGRDLATADRALRGYLPAADLRGPAEEAGGILSDREHRRMIAWQATRLADDFAVREARQLLSDARRGGAGAEEVEELKKAQDLVDGRARAKMALLVEKTPRRMVVDRQGDLPPGVAAAFAPRGASGTDSSVRVEVARGDADGPNLMKVPAREPVGLIFLRDNKEVPPRKALVFYRGKFFSPREELAGAKDEDLVDVSIHQRYLEGEIYGRKGRRIKVKTPDQFDRHKNRGFLHPANPLDYKLTLRNKTDRPLKLAVTHGLDGLTPYTDTIELDPKRSIDAVFGTVQPSDLPDTGEERKLTVKITEEDADGRRVARDLIVPFQKIKPQHGVDIGTAVWFLNGRLAIEVTHSPNDRVTSPALVYLKVEPFNAIRQIDQETVNLQLGQTGRYEYLITDPTIPKVKWTLLVDEVPVHQQEEQINRLPDKPGAPPAGGGPGGPGGDGGAGGPQG